MVLINTHMILCIVNRVFGQVKNRRKMILHYRNTRESINI